MTAWPGGIAALTLFVEDLAACRTFYREVLGLAPVFEEALGWAGGASGGARRR